MLRLGVISDTHMPHMAKRLPRAVVAGFLEEKIDMLVHCGDMLAAAAIEQFAAIAPFEAVAGNNDDGEIVRRFGYKKVLQIGNVRIGLIHGHGAQSRTRTPDHAFAAFRNDDVQAVLFGHSHIPLCEWRAGRLLFNPGSPTDKRRQPKYSYGILRIDHESIAPELRYFDDKEP